MRVLVLGSGGREHALAWKIHQSPKVTGLFCIPGNAGIHLIAECPQVEIDGKNGFTALLQWIEANQIDLTVVGPEAPLADGIVDAFQKKFASHQASQAGSSSDFMPKIFGPDRASAQLEASKVFCKEFLLSQQISTAKAHTCTSEQEVVQRVDEMGLPIVLKADGLASGKGVWVCQTQGELEAALKAFFSENRYGRAAQKVLVEECLVGEEVSFMAICDGSVALPFATSQDHKRAFDGDQGPNTGGMGAYSPASAFDDEKMTAEIMRTVIAPTLKGMRERGTPYRGMLYAGLMLTSCGPKVLEYNCRFGDPECQALLMRLNTDLVDVILASLDQSLDQIHLQWDENPAICVVMASPGYPENPKTGYVISGLESVQFDSQTNSHDKSHDKSYDKSYDKLYDDTQNCMVFHAGTRLENNQFLTHGGRVLGVTAMGKNLKAAKEKAYACVDKISWQGEHHRLDISDKAIGEGKSNE